MSQNKLALVLYKDIVKRAKQFDKSPALKICVIPPELHSIFGDKLYVPSHPPKKFVDIVREKFRENKTPLVSS